jgi:hypothetical protein
MKILMNNFLKNQKIFRKFLIIKNSFAIFYDEQQIILKNKFNKDNFIKKIQEKLESKINNFLNN